MRAAEVEESREAMAASRHGGLVVWLLQRVTGLFLVYALVVHLWAVHVVSNGRLTWETIAARLSGDMAWTVYYGLFIPAVVAHAALGVWSVALDYHPSPGLRRAIAVGLWTAAVALTAYGYLGIRPLLQAAGG